MARPSPAARPKTARSNLPAELSPRERLLRRGAAALSDAELLSVVLLNGSSEAPALRQAVDLLHESAASSAFSASTTPGAARVPRIAPRATHGAVSASNITA